MERTGWTASAVLLAVCAVGACGGEEHVAEAPRDLGSASPEPVDGVTGNLVPTRQRDLLDRGLIDVQLIDEVGHDITMTDRQLVVAGFTTEPAEPRTSRIPTGRPVNLQVPYGTANDCDGGATVEASLHFVYTTSDDDRPRSGRVDIGGTELLEAIRDQQCAQRRFDATVDVRLTAPVVDGERLDTTLTLTPRPDAPLVELRSASGTILVGARLGTGAVAIDGRAMDLPVVFEVNRCDAHAMAEVTKPFGLDLFVSFDGDEPRRVAIDVAPVVDGLDAIVANCRDATETG